MATRSNSKVLTGVVLGVVVAVSAAAIAQAPPTVAPPPVVAAPAVVAPVVPQAPAQNPGTLAAIEESVKTAPQVSSPQAVAAVAPGSIVQPTGPAPYVVPPSGPGIFQGSDQTLREISYLQTEVALNGKRKERVDSVSALKAAEKDLEDQLAGRSKDDKSGASGSPAGLGPLPSGAMAVPLVAPKPEPYVNSVYGYGKEMYAEIVVGSTKVLATKGTILLDGSRVVSVSNSGVTLSTKRGTKKLAIRGAASY